MNLDWNYIGANAPGIIFWVVGTFVVGSVILNIIINYIEEKFKSRSNSAYPESQPKELNEK